MKRGRRRITDYFQADVKNAGYEALSLEPAAKASADKSIQVGLAADLEALIRLGLGELLVKHYENGHGEVVGGLIVANQDVHDRPNRHASEFHGSTRVQSFER